MADPPANPAARPAGPAAPVAGPRLDDEAVRERLGRVDELLGQVEQQPGPSAERALDAVSMLLEVYGEALARACGYAAQAPTVLAALTGDELLAHLLVLHDAHPDPVERRAGRALEALRPTLAAAGAEAELRGVDGTTATVRLRGASGCGSAATTAAAGDAVRDAILALAPELTEVRVVAAHEQAFVPVEALLDRPAALGATP